MLGIESVIGLSGFPSLDIGFTPKGQSAVRSVFWISGILAWINDQAPCAAALRTPVSILLLCIDGFVLGLAARLHHCLGFNLKSVSVRLLCGTVARLSATICMILHKSVLSVKQRERPS